VPQSFHIKENSSRAHSKGNPREWKLNCQSRDRVTLGIDLFVGSTKNALTAAQSSGFEPGIWWPILACNEQMGHKAHTWMRMTNEGLALTVRCFFLDVPCAEIRLFRHADLFT
jgi:hypothetical protein